MPDFAHIANAFATDPLASLLLAIALSFVLLILSECLWWVHGAFGLLLLIVSIIFYDQRHLSFDSFLVVLFAFPSLCRDIPNQPLLFRIRIFWFAAFALIPPSSPQPATACSMSHRSTSCSSNGRFQSQPS